MDNHGIFPLAFLMHLEPTQLKAWARKIAFMPEIRKL
jgi:hypothetical protein